MELWDLYDENRQALGRTHRRGEELKDGENHTVVAIWVVNSRQEILMTLRHPEKEEYPNKWENTGGSALAGESSKEGAVRELFEETGIRVTEEDLFLLGTTKESTAFVDLYVTRKDVSLSYLIMQEGETVGAKWVSLEELDQHIQDGSLAKPIGERLLPYREKFVAFLENK